MMTMIVVVLMIVMVKKKMMMVVVMMIMMMKVLVMVMVMMIMMMMMMMIKVLVVVMVMMMMMMMKVLVVVMVIMMMMMMIVLISVTISQPLTKPQSFTLVQIGSICRRKNKCCWSDRFSLSGMVENIVGKGEKCWLPAFSLFPTMFSKALFFRVLKSRDRVVKSLYM